MHKTLTEEKELTPRELFPDVTFKRVHCAYICPCCKHDNRGKGQKCAHYFTKVDGRENIPHPPIGGRHVIAQSYSNPSDQTLLQRYIVYEER